MLRSLPHPTLWVDAVVPNPTILFPSPVIYHININISDSCVLYLFSLPILYCRFLHPSLLTVIPFSLIPSSLSVLSSPDTDLALRFLCLGGVLVVGRLTVRAVVFTVVIGCPGVCHDQQLLDVSLEWREGRRGERRQVIGSHSILHTGGFWTGKFIWFFSSLPEFFYLV